MAKTVPWLDRPTPKFSEAFPQVEEALLSYYETGDGIESFKGHPEPGKYNYPQPVSEPQMRCSNTRCERGGYYIEGELRRMVNRKKTDHETVVHCRGDEGSPKGRDKGPSCMNSLHLRLAVKYKPESTQQTTPQPL